ncbi:MAG TPA: hypothetical protein VNT75_19240 [Symbiobacteriaceae bacterium]|nr:hypothetical protein [Symbiobacteriaceae bacterium]
MLTLTLGTAAILGCWCLLFWHTFGTLFTPGPSEFVPDPQKVDPLEAHRWLSNGAELAHRRFPSGAEALRFVDRLYELGAVSVRIIWLLDSGYAEGLLVSLPSRPAARRRLFDVAAHEAEEPEEDHGQPFLRLVWNE